MKININTTFFNFERLALTKHMITISNLEKKYVLSKDNIVYALDDLSVEIEEKSILAVVGPSGSGKSTLMNIIGGLDRDYKGSIEIDGKDIKKYNSNYYRRFVVGTIFQQFYLVPTLNVEENILLPLVFGKQIPRKQIKTRLNYMLKRVGLEDRRKHKPNQLSGGQAQRVAIARALIAKPKILLADEPTGNLDTKTGDDIIKLIRELNVEEGNTTIIITHDSDVAKRADKSIYLRDGKRVK